VFFLAQKTPVYLITIIFFSFLHFSSRVHSVGPFVDIIGIDVVTPSQLGMTTDQWREMKKSVMNDIPENDFDSC